MFFILRDRDIELYESVEQLFKNVVLYMGNVSYYAVYINGER